MGIEGRNKLFDARDLVQNELSRQLRSGEVNRNVFYEQVTAIQSCFENCLDRLEKDPEGIISEFKNAFQHILPLSAG